MKGPYERLKYELRRVFECSHCHRRIRIPASFTSSICTCTPADGQLPVMKLVEDGMRRVDGKELPRAHSRLS